MIEIINYEKNEKTDASKVIGYVDVKVTISKPTTFILRKIAHLESQDKKWLNFPSYPKEQLDRTKKYYRYAEFSEQTVNTTFLNLLSEEVKKYLEKEKVEDEGLPF